MQDVQINHFEVLQIIGKRIALQRKKLKLSQRQLALECGWDKSFLQRIEWGKTNYTAKTILILCHSLQMTVSELFFNVEVQAKAEVEGNQK